MPELSEQDAAVLAFERRWWKFPGMKEQAIRDTFGISPTRYYQRLIALIRTPEALQADPVTVKRLLRLHGPPRAG